MLNKERIVQIAHEEFPYACINKIELLVELILANDDSFLLRTEESFIKEVQEMKKTMKFKRMFISWRNKQKQKVS